ncbi:hypothetical protein GGF43_000106 [Coemansia sp. RSA 2618]|nr:hypothetical protein GGF43_000106 [Coemansia sp. RSA 2618]
MTLSHTDIDALQPGEWVTDDVIDFYFNQHIKDLVNDANALDYETQCLRKPRSIRVAFLPIFGDNHWSLLVYRNHKPRTSLPEFLHFNSHLNSTRENHTQCARTALINLLYVFRENDPQMSISKESYKLVVKNCPQQTNGNDCGVYVCMDAYILSTRLAREESEGRGSSPLHALVKRLSFAANSSPPLGRKADSPGLVGKKHEKDRSDAEELQWKIKDRDAVRPDDMRAYLTNVIYKATYTRSTSASL